MNESVKSLFHSKKSLTWLSALRLNIALWSDVQMHIPRATTLTQKHSTISQQ